MFNSRRKQTASAFFTHPRIQPIYSRSALLRKLEGCKNERIYARIGRTYESDRIQEELEQAS